MVAAVAAGAQPLRAAAAGLDAPAGGREVMVCLSVHRFFYPDPGCAKATIPDQVTGLTSAHADAARGSPACYRRSRFRPTAEPSCCRAHGSKQSRDRQGRVAFRIESIMCPGCGVLGHSRASVVVFEQPLENRGKRPPSLGRG